MIRKHAYLIMVHKNTYVLEKLLLLIDDVRNDIFIHVDKKCSNFDYKKYKSCICKSNLYFTEPRIDVVCGGYSQIDCEMKLLSFATNVGNYAYYHLLSGQDLPLKNQDYIHSVCDNSSSKEYIDCFIPDTNTEFGTHIYHRVSLKRIFSQRLRNKSRFINGINKVWLGIQAYIFHVDYVKKHKIDLKYGANWFSLTQAAATTLIDNENRIKALFQHSGNPDEVFAQTILAENGFQTHMTENKRLVFWQPDDKLHPYIWRECDFDKLIGSSDFFARKFDEIIDREIIDKLYNQINGKLT